MSDLSRVFKDVEGFVSDTGKEFEKQVSDYYKSDFMRVAAPTVIGFFIGGPVGAAMGASYGLSSIQQAKAYESAEALQETQIAAQKEMQRRQIELAGQQYTLTEEQMKLQMGQRQIGMLADLYLEQDRTEPRILTLPASREPPGIIDRINLWMDQALRA